MYKYLLSIYVSVEINLFTYLHIEKNRIFKFLVFDIIFVYLVYYFACSRNIQTRDFKILQDIQYVHMY